MAPGGDETIRSNESSLYGQASSIKRTDKVQAYVDFSDYERNYKEYMEEHGMDPNDDRPLSVIMKEAEMKKKEVDTKKGADLKKDTGKAKQ